MGLCAPTSGSIELLGVAMPEHALEVKGKIGLVPDETLLFDHLKGLEFTEFVGRTYGLASPVAHERSRELLALFKLDGELIQPHRRLFQGHAEARGDGRHPHPSSGAVPAGRAFRGRRRGGRQAA